MELVLAPGRIGGENNTGSPFQNQEVREWSHVDRLTGMLEHARIETGRWQTRHQGTAQAYGKVIDSRERNSADGNVVQKARRQVEVFQSHGIGGRSVQVFRASQWSSSRITDSTSSSPSSVSTNDVPQLRNPTDELMRSTDESLTKLSRVSRLCRQIQNGDGMNVNKRTNLQNADSNNEMGTKSPLLGNRFKTFDGNDVRKDSQQLERLKLPASEDNNLTNNLKANSNEDLTKSIIGSNSKSQMIMFARDCKIRRSLQIPKSAVGYSDFDMGNKINEIETKPQSASTRNSPSYDADLSVLKNDRKSVKSYVLGMEEADSEFLLNLPKKITDRKILFNSASFDENGRDGDVAKSDYLRPTPILLKPKSNTTVVHLNNKSYLDSRKNDSDSIVDKIDSVATVNSKSRVQSLASRFSNGNNNNFKLTTVKDHGGAESMIVSQNTFSHNTSTTDGSSSSSSSSSSSTMGKKQFIIDSSSRIESLINRSTAINGGENAIEIFPSALLEKKIAGGAGEELVNSKPVKKVGFCKTEVHFAAESGKVNIVETDCKPPPSNRFRRRRRINSTVNNAGIANSKNLPLIHFGDTSYEKYIFGQSSNSNDVTKPLKNDNSSTNENDITSPATARVSEAPVASGEGVSPLQNDKKTILEEKLNQLASDESIIRDGWRSRLKTIMQCEPPTIITADENNDDDADLMNSERNFHIVDETIVDHSFKGHTTTVNLGASNVIPRLKKHTNEGKCNSTISTGIQLQFDTTRFENVQTKIASNLSNITPRIGVARVNPVEKNRNISNGDRNHAPYPMIVVSTVSKIPRPLIQTQQTVLKSAHLVMSLNKINNFNSLVESTTASAGNNNYNSYLNNSTGGKSVENSSLALERLLSSLQDNHRREMVIRGGNSDVDIVNNNHPPNVSTLITINADNRSMDYRESKSLTMNGNSYPLRFTPPRSKHVHNNRLNEPEERKKGVKLSNDNREDNNQLQYSSGSEQADEEVRSYMLGTKNQRSSYTNYKKSSGTISASKMGEFMTTNTEKSEDEHLISNTGKDTTDNDDSIDIIDRERSQRMIDDDEFENIVESGLPDEEICFEANRTVEKTHLVDEPLRMNEKNVVTSDNENNKVLLNIVETHEPVTARVEDSGLPETVRKRELLIAGSKKLRPHNSVITTKQQQREEKETILREPHTISNNKSTSSINEKKRTMVKLKAKDHCDSNKAMKEVPTSSLVDEEIATADPTYVNVFQNGKTRSVPIYENYRVDRKNNNNKNDSNNRTGKQHSKNIIRSEIMNEVSTDASVIRNCENETSSMSGKNCEEEENLKKLQYATPRDSDVIELAEDNSISKMKNNTKNYSNKIKQSKTKSRKIVRRPSSTSSIEEGAGHRNSGNEIAKEISQAKPAAGLHTKSTRSSRLHRVTPSSHETFGNEIIMERYISSNDDKKKSDNNSERISNKQKLSRSDCSPAVIDTISTKNKNDEGKKNANDSVRSKKPIEIVYQTAVFNMKNEKLAKSSKSKEPKTTPRYINDLICGISKPKRTTDSRHAKGTSQSQQRAHLQKSASPTNRYWK